MAEPKPSEDFTALRSDIKLRELMAKLVCENPSDRVAVDFIMAQKQGLTKAQRDWCHVLLARKGKKFVFKEPSKK